MTLLRVSGVDVTLGRTQILHQVDLEVHAGDIVGIIGETGSGKTTLARTIVGLIDPDVGEIAVDGQVTSRLTTAERRAFRRTGKVQYVFQDPLRSLDPDFTVGAAVAEGLAIQGGADRRSRVDSALEAVGLDPTLQDRKPGQISGGQRQRVCLARAIVMNPALLICDEPVSALDVSNRNHILLLLDELRQRLNVAIVLISHDLSSLAGIADRVAVLYQGRVVEEGTAQQVFTEPGHPYTELLVASAPSIHADERIDPGRRKELREKVALAH